MHPSLTPPPADALLFDGDGTLVDSQDANYRAMSHALSSVGIHLEKGWFDSRTGISSAEMIELLAHELGVTLLVSVDELVGRRDARFLEKAKSIRPHAAVLEVVEAAPAPDIFLNAAAALSADPARCVVYEDRGNDSDR